MKKFKVVITETSSKLVEVQANNEQEALAKVEEMYENCEVVLDWNDFDETDYTIIEAKEYVEE